MSTEAKVITTLAEHAARGTYVWLYAHNGERYSVSVTVLDNVAKAYGAGYGERLLELWEHNDAAVILTVRGTRVTDMSVGADEVAR